MVPSSKGTEWVRNTNLVGTEGGHHRSSVRLKEAHDEILDFENQLTDCRCMRHQMHIT